MPTKSKFAIEVPDHVSPGEVLNDEQLAVYYAERAAAAPDDPKLALLAARHGRSAALTRATLEGLAARDAAELQPEE